MFVRWKLFSLPRLNLVIKKSYQLILQNPARETKENRNSNKGIKDLQSLTKRCKSIKERATQQYNCTAKTPQRPGRTAG